VSNALPTLSGSVFDSARRVSLVNLALLRNIIRCDSSFSMAWTRMANFRSNL
jgi:hypothetical protein